jgi:RNA 2',3'-cyclic 3'-phosphodiesterase
MRIFIGIDLADEVRGKIVRFLEGVSGFAPDARWVKPESLHVTLKFIGEQKQEQVAAISERLRKVESASFEISVRGCGFFPTPRAPRVFWIGIEAGPKLAQLAANIDAATAELGIPREERAFNPHLTLARAGGKSGDPKWRKGDSPNSVFAVLQKRLAAMDHPDSGPLNFGNMTADKFILYQSQLSPAGSKYTRLEQFPMSAIERV